MAQLFNTDEVFNVDYEYFYETALTPEITSKEVTIIKDLLDLETNMKILDLPCGYGRIANQLAYLGCDIVGIDTNEEYLKKARLDAQSYNLSTQYLLEDMRNIMYSNEFDAVINWHNSFGYFEDDENRRLLFSVYQALKPGGKLLLEQVNRDKILRHLLPGGALWTDALLKDDNMMIDRIRYSIESGRMNVIRVITKNGKIKKVPYSFRIFTFTEIKQWLLSTGFSAVEVYGENGQKFTLDSKRMIVVAYK
ncbi:class I SAM-dependent methyltransferase (plasmid) [Priestia aryabhattai]